MIDEKIEKEKYDFNHQFHSKNENNKNNLENKLQIRKKFNFINNSNRIVKKISFSYQPKIRKNKNLYLSSFSINISNKNTIIKFVKTENFSLIPKDDFEIEEEDELKYLSSINPKGLKNLGGCCYMNSTLQCFYHIKEFTNYFLKDKKKIKSKKGLISTGLLDVIEGLSKKDSNTYYIPQKFKRNLIKFDESFRGSEGKDSADLVELILSACQEELGGELDFPNTSLDQRQESLLFLDVFYKNSKVQSIIFDLFTFYLKIRNKCDVCGVSYYDIASENMITFDLEQVFKFPSIILGDYSNLNYNKRIVSIDDCLECFSFDGHVTKNIICKYCKNNTLIYTIKSFATLPKYLIMHMSRGENEKFECDVNFNEMIDLSLSYDSVEGLPKEEDTIYTLIAGTILWGSKGYGHTVAFCRHFNGEYFIFNDSGFSKTNFEYIKKQKIYLLFYKKNI